MDIISHKSHARFLCTITAVAVLAGLAGCAAPIKSWVATDSAATVDGFIYYLPKSNVTVAVPFRLASCSPAEVEMLAPSALAKASADADKRFRVNPSDSWNLFRSIETGKISLTADRRLVSTEASVKDNTVATLSGFIKVAPGLAQLVNPASESAVRAQNAQSTGEQEKPLVFSCASEAATLVKERADLRSAIQALRNLRSDLPQKQPMLGKALPDVLSGIEETITRNLLRVADLDARLTKQVSISVSFKEGQAEAKAVEYVDLGYGWFEAQAGDTACNSKSKKAPACTEIRVSSNHPRSTPAGGGNASAMSVDTPKIANEYNGIWYRIPATATPKVCVDQPNATRLAGLKRTKPADDALSALTVPVTKVKAVADPTDRPDSSDSFCERASFYSDSTNSVLIAQWGTLGQLTSDVGYLTSNSVKIEFDEWSVPKTVSWSADPATIPGLLGLVPQANSAFAKPAADPTAGLRSDLLTQMLQICIAALAGSGAIPSYCSSILK